MKRTIILLSVALVYALSATMAMATDAVEFDGTYGVVQFSPGVGNLLTSIDNLDTAIFNGTHYALHNAVLQFYTGPELSDNHSNPLMATFGAGGLLDITGGIPALGIADGTTLFAASFTSGAMVQFPFNNSGSFLGHINSTSGRGAVELFLCDPQGINCPAPPQGSLVAGSITIALPSPEPSSLMLLGTGLASVLGLIRRKA